MNQETIFVKNRNGFNISLRFTRPETQTGLAFILHGFSGDKDQREMRALEEEFSKRGYMVANIDATNSLNASEWTPAGASFTGHYNDLEYVIEWARGQAWFQSPFALAGHSMGAAAVLLYAENHPDNANLLIPISFPWLTGASKIAQDDDPEKYADWKAAGYWDKVSASRGRTLRVPYNFIEDLQNHDFGAKAARITAPTFLIIGELEKPQRITDNKKLFDMLRVKKEFIILPNTPHAVAKTAENEKAYRNALAHILDSKAEFIDIFDEHWNPTGEILEKNEAERQKKWHRAAHIWIVNSNGEVLLQLRSPNKKSSPNWWDISAAGHVRAGESVIDAGIRETREELGITITGDELTQIWTDESPTNQHLHTWFIMMTDLPPDAFTFNDHEVAAVKYVPWRKIAAMSDDEKRANKILPHKGFLPLFEYLEDKGL
ncbi:MAG: NUDIX domain-containing protein [Rickettsiales bacterium]|jgi:isopentenyldiphosphate isomerase/pimeloyl-ACP methyl ester carboxylesterase|nr:NUDIX domain-containing protein [Rickettsiales bacterium]